LQRGVAASHRPVLLRSANNLALSSSTSSQSYYVIGAMREVVIVALVGFLIGIMAAALLVHFLP
jgi:hypothetical protein